MSPPKINGITWHNNQNDALLEMREKHHSLIFKWGMTNFASIKNTKTFISLIKKTELAQRQYYEVLLENQPQRMFADIDGEGLSITREALYTEWNELMKFVFEKVGLVFDESKVRLLNSKGNKISGHWAYCDDLYFKNSKDQKLFWNYVNSIIETKYENLCFTKTRADEKIELTNVLDLSVYSNNRAYRTILSHKNDKNRVLVPVNLVDGKIVELKKYNMADYIIFLRSDQIKCYELVIPEFEKIRTKYYSRAMIEKIILDNVPSVKIGEFKGRLITLKNIGCRTCIIKHEENASDNSYVIWRRDGLYYGCHDDGCRGILKNIFNTGTTVSNIQCWNDLFEKTKLVKTEANYQQLRNDVVSYMNTLYSLVLEGAKVMVIYKKNPLDCDTNSITNRVEQDVVMMTKNSLEDMLDSKHISVKFVDNDKKNEHDIKPFNIWWYSRYRAEYEGVVFEPYGESMTPPKSIRKSYNLWDGYAITLNDCVNKEILTIENSYVLNHIFKRWALGDIDVYNWIMGYCATILQRPEKKLASTVVLHGKEGACKGLPLQIIKAIIGDKYFFAPTSVDEVLDGFNSNMKAKKIIHFDELTWGGDKSKAGILKKLITEETFTIKTKYLPDVVIRNVFAAFISSNEDWVVPAGSMARRYCVLDVSNEFAGIEKNHPDLMNIINEIHNKEYILRFAKTLYTWDLTNFNDRKPPLTTGLRIQKQMSFRPYEKMVETIINQGYISIDDVEYKIGEFVPKADVFKHYQKEYRDPHISAKVFWTKLGDILHWDFSKTYIRKLNYKNHRCIKLPSLTQMKVSFCSHVGDKNWKFDENFNENEENFNENEENFNENEENFNENEENFNENEENFNENELDDAFEILY